MPLQIEDIGSGSSEYGGGIVPTEIYVGYHAHMPTIEAPKDKTGANAAATVEELVTITGNHIFEANYGFTKINALIEKNGFESGLIGDRKFRLFENKVTILVKGSDARTLGALRAFNNEDCIVLFKEAGSKQFRQIGHADYPADMNEAGNTIAETYEGENLSSFIFMDKNKAPAPIYSGDITLQPALP